MCVRNKQLQGTLMLDRYPWVVRLSDGGLVSPSEHARRAGSRPYSWRETTSAIKVICPTPASRPARHQSPALTGDWGWSQRSHGLHEYTTVHKPAFSLRRSGGALRSQSHLPDETCSLSRRLYEYTLTAPVLHVQPGGSMKVGHFLNEMGIREPAEADAMVPRTPNGLSMAEKAEKKRAKKARQRAAQAQAAAQTTKVRQLRQFSHPCFHAHGHLTGAFRDMYQT